MFPGSARLSFTTLNVLFSIATQLRVNSCSVFTIKCCVTTYTKDQNHMRCKLHIPGSLHIITTVIAKYKGAARQLKMSMKLTYIEQRTAIDQLYVQNV